MERRSTTVALSVDQLRTLASPVRAEIVRMLSSEQRMSIKELAAGIGRSANRLYPHMAKLQSAGLIRAAETRRVGARTEAIYELVSRHLSSAQAARTNAGRTVLGVVAERFLASAARRFKQAVEGAEVSLEGPE